LIANANPGQVSAGFMAALLNLVLYDQTHARRFMAFGSLTSGPLLARTRTDIVEAFLGTTAQWLLQVDSDMRFPPDALDRLLEHADAQERPIVGAACALGEGSPNTYWFDGAFPEARLVSRFPPSAAPACVRVDGTGGAFLLVHRSVFFKIGRSVTGQGLWYAPDSLAAGIIGEDLMFCRRAHAAGLPVHVACGIGVEHEKMHWLPAPHWAIAGA